MYASRSFPRPFSAWMIITASPKRARDILDAFPRKLWPVTDGNLIIWHKTINQQRGKCFRSSNIPFTPRHSMAVEWVTDLSRTEIGLSSKVQITLEALRSTKNRPTTITLEACVSRQSEHETRRPSTSPTYAPPTSHCSRNPRHRCSTIVLCTPCPQDVQPSSSEVGGGRGSEMIVADVPSAAPLSPTVTSLVDLD